MHDNSGPRSVYTYPVHKDIMKKIYQCMYMYINLYVHYISSCSSKFKFTHQCMFLCQSSSQFKCKV